MGDWIKYEFDSHSQIYDISSQKLARHEYARALRPIWFAQLEAQSPEWLTFLIVLPVR